MTCAPCPKCARGPSPSWLPCRNCGGYGFTIVFPAEGRALRQEMASANTLRAKLVGAR